MEALDGAIAMCTRSAGRFQEEEVEKLWFRTLDALVLRQRDIKNELANISFTSIQNIQSSPPKGDDKSRTTLNTAKLLPGHVSAASNAMLQMLGEGINTVLETMKSFVPLNHVLSKVLSDHSRAEFSEFRETITSMMSTYSYEGRLLATANHLMSVDIYKQVQRLHNGYAAAVAPSRSRNLCAACNTNLVLISGGGKIVTVANNNTTDDNMDTNYDDNDNDEGNDDDDTLQNKAKSTNSLFMVFGCGHCYHERCLPMAMVSCPLCTQKENTNSNNQQDNNNGNTMDDLNSKSLRRGALFSGKVAIFGDTMRLRNNDNTNDGDNDTNENGYNTTSRRPLGGDNNDDNNENIYMERLNRTKEKIRRTKPLIDLLDELSVGSGKIQLRNMNLDTSVPTVINSDEFKIIRNPPKLRNMEEATNSCTYAKIEVPPFSD